MAENIINLWLPTKKAAKSKYNELDYQGFLMSPIEKDGGGYSFSYVPENKPQYEGFKEVI